MLSLRLAASPLVFFPSLSLLVLLYVALVWARMVEADDWPGY